jgi:hypothetical protein
MLHVLPIFAIYEKFQNEKQTIHSSVADKRFPHITSDRMWRRWRQRLIIYHRRLIIYYRRLTIYYRRLTNYRNEL